MQTGAGQDEYAAQRELMVAEQLIARGIRAENVLAAMRRVPRELFMPAGQELFAYCDAAQPIECQQTISQPYMVARMTELLELTPEKQVLEVGTGSGYQTAVLASLAKQVYSVEWHLKLLTQAAERLERLGLRNIALRCADGSLGWPERAPFDGIIATAGAPQVPPTLVAQLAPGGRLVIPVGPIGDQTLVLAVRTEAGLRTEEVLKCRFVKLLGAEGWKP
jgi:protein-L-isoaspartate(D-aspartate) O-methyltransferase